MENNLTEPTEAITTWQKLKGLMFQKVARPIIFRWPEPTHLFIHSYFCKPFVAIWFREGEIVDYKIVKPNQTQICPHYKFDTLLEVPIDYMVASQ